MQVKSYPITIKPFGQNALLIEWPNKVSEAILNDILQFEALLKEKNLQGFEYVPAYNSLTLISGNGIANPTEYKDLLLQWYSKMEHGKRTDQFLWTLPVCYDEEFGIDLDQVSNTLGFSVEALIEKHTSNVYTVYGIGFLPGFMYLGGLPDELVTKRKKEPRLKVRKGSVGLAGRQTGIYPQDSPGGWNIIGNCPIPIFDATKKEPCFVKVGDKIRFEAITRAEYDLHKIEGEVGIFNFGKTELNV